MKRVVILVSSLMICSLISRAQPATQEYPWGNGGKPSPATSLAWDRYYIEGFAWPMSVASGTDVTLYVSMQDTIANNRLFDMRIYRIPQQGTPVLDVDSLVAGYIPLHDSVGNAIHYYDNTHTRKPKDFLDGCRTTWTGNSITVQTAGWVSGLYYAQLRPRYRDTLWYNIPFVVRAANPGSTSKVLFKFNLTTFQAYNWWGGGSLYSPAQEASLETTNIIAIDRPLTVGQSQAISDFYLEYFAQLLEDSGYVMEYSNNIDFAVDTTHSFLSNYKTILLWNHDEYWSQLERENTEFFLSNHGNLLSYSPNTCYWQIQWLDGELSKLYCGKWLGVPSTRFRDPLVNNPEARFLGEQYQHGWNSISGDWRTEEPPAVVSDSSHWIFRGTGLRNGDSLGRGFLWPDSNQVNRPRGIVGGELDNTITGRASFPLDTLAQRWVYSRVDTGGTVRYGTIMHQMVYYEDTLSNARVFAAGAGAWMAGLKPSAIDQNDLARMRQITINLISHFSGQKYLGKVWTYGPLNALEWASPVELDGDVNVPEGRYLKVISTTVTIDSGVTFSINGTLEINGSVTLVGPGKLHVGATGQIVLTNGATLNLRTTILTDPNVIITVPVEAALNIRPPGTIAFGQKAGLVAYGTLSARGTAQESVFFTRLPSAIPPVGISLPSGIDTLEYCHISDMITGVTIGHSAATLRNNHFVNCQTAILSDAWKWSPIIQENAIDSCGIGLDVFTTSVIGVPVIDQNTATACTYGIILNSSYKSILTDNHVQNGHVGMVVSNSSPVLYRNVIQGNDSLGVFAVEAANPRFGDYLQDDPGNNVIRNNGAVQVYAVNATPFFGLQDLHDYGGYNSIYGSEDAEILNVVAEDGSEVTAHIAWWGVYPPNEKRFAADDKSIIDFSNALDYDPNESLRPAGMVAFNGKSDPPDLPQMSITPEQRQLRRALVFRTERSYAEAISAYTNLITSRPNTPESRIALVELRNTYHDYLLWSGDSTLQTTLENYLRVQLFNHPNALIKRVARFLRASEISNRRDYSTAITEYQQLLESSASEEERLTCLFVLFNINAMGLHDRSGAQSWLGQLQNQDPDDFRTQIAAIRFAGMSERTSGNGLQRMSLAQTGGVNQQLPLQFNLSQNYPNPFNPSTTIKYDLPVDTHVALRVYDVLGREVLTLVDEQTKAGNHAVTFDASAFASGVYFYHIQAGEFSQTKKLIVLR